MYLCSLKVSLQTTVKLVFDDKKDYFNIPFLSLHWHLNVTSTVRSEDLIVSCFLPQCTFVFRNFSLQSTVKLVFDDKKGYFNIPFYSLYWPLNLASIVRNAYYLKVSCFMSSSVPLFSCKVSLQPTVKLVSDN